MSTTNIDWKACTEVSLSVDTIGALGEFMPARESGIVIPISVALELDQPVRVNVQLGDPPRVVSLFGYVDEFVGGDETQVRIQLDRKSWKRLFVAVCRTPWRRRDDFRPANDRKRTNLTEDAFVFVPRTGQRFEASILEVSDGGAFIGVDAACVKPGDEVRFRGRHDMGWHSAEVRWHGRKSSRSGVGVSLDFGVPEDRSRWVTWANFASRRAA